MIEERTPATARPMLALAALSASAGVIHAVMAPSHMDEWVVEGVAFALAAWIQLLLAAALLRSPHRLVLQLVVGTNLALLAAWVVSRGWGLPFGPEAGVAHDIDFIAAVCAGIEVALVLGATAALLPRGLHLGRLPSMAATAGVVALTTTALLSPSARASGGHSHAGDDIGRGFAELHNGEHAEIEPYELDAGSQQLLDEQLDVTRAVARRYPTVEAAEAAGYEKAGPYAPGLGTHYVLPSGPSLNADGRFDEGDLEQPLSLQYDGSEPDSKIAGFMYYSIGATEPEGFVGRNDVWHVHQELCLRSGPNGIEAPYGADKQATPEQCAAVGGTIQRQTQWMLHVWSVPGYENEAGGVFGEHNPKLTCADGSYHQLPADEWADNLDNICRSQ